MTMLAFLYMIDPVWWILTGLIFICSQTHPL